MVWGAISATGPVAFGFVGGKITARQYIEVLRNLLLPSLDNIPLNRLAQTVFQQDNARPHSAHATQQFLEDNSIRTTLWPAKSPDLNPIEKVWAEMKRYIRSIGPTTIPALRRAILDSWNEVVTEELCRQLYASLPNCINTVISRRGSR